jgi:proteic killer suppression protein
MIKSFKSKETEKFFSREYSLKLPPTIQKVALRKLWMIDASTSLQDLTVPPSNHLEKLKGDYKDKYSIRINDQWRICFSWEENNAHDLEIIDYH